MTRALLALLVPLALLAGIWLGGHGRLLPEPLRDFARDDEVAVVEDALERVHDDYYREVSRAELAEAAVEGMVERLDRFSAYFDPREYARFREANQARFTGIGVSVTRHDDGLRVTRVYARSPARSAGLRAGDVITHADGRALAGRHEDAASGLIRGPAGTSVTLTVERDGRPFERRVTRSEVTIPAAHATRRRAGGREIAVIRLESFSEGAHGEVIRAARDAVRDRVDGIVLDLRGNGGGLVDEARLVTSVFLREGKIVTTRGRAVRERVFSASGRPVAPDVPLVVLVDRDSASAAEIVTGALQDRGRAKVVGQRTFGKGVFQTVVELDNGGALDLTVGQYFTPNGRNLGRGVERGAGIQPDVRAADEPRTSRDEALERAIAVLG